MGISENIRGMRKMAGYSQVFLAKLIKVDKCTVGAWENGIQKPNSDHICALCKVFKVSADELLGLKAGPRYYNQEFGLEFDQEPNPEIERAAGIGLSELREEYGMTRRELAGALDVTVRTVGNWEANGLPGIKQYQKIFRLFDLDRDTFQDLR